MLSWKHFLVSFLFHASDLMTFKCSYDESFLRKLPKFDFN